MTILNRLRQDNRGANLVEMAAAFMLLMLLLLAVADLGRLFHTYTVMTNAVREGARYGSHFPEDLDGIKKVTVDEAAESGVTLDSDKVTLSDTSGVAPGELIGVQIEHQFETIMGGLVGLGTIMLRAQADMVIFGLDV